MKLNEILDHCSSLIGDTVNERTISNEYLRALSELVSTIFDMGGEFAVENSTRVLVDLGADDVTIKEVYGDDAIAFAKEYKELMRIQDDIRDIAIKTVDKLVEEGLVKNCLDSDDNTEFQVQDIIYANLYARLSTGCLSDQTFNY